MFSPPVAGVPEKEDQENGAVETGSLVQNKRGQISDEKEGGGCWLRYKEERNEPAETRRIRGGRGGEGDEER